MFALPPSIGPLSDSSPGLDNAHVGCLLGPACVWITDSGSAEARRSDPSRKSGLGKQKTSLRPRCLLQGRRRLVGEERRRRIDWPPPYRGATEKYSAQICFCAAKLSFVGSALAVDGCRRSMPINPRLRSSSPAARFSPATTTISRMRKRNGDRDCTEITSSRPPWRTPTSSAPPEFGKVGGREVEPIRIDCRFQTNRPLLDSHRHIQSLPPASFAGPGSSATDRPIPQ